MGLILVVGCMMCGLVSTRRSLRELRLTEHSRRGDGTRGSNRNIAAEIKQVRLNSIPQCIVGIPKQIQSMKVYNTLTEF